MSVAFAEMPSRNRKTLLPNNVLGMVIFVFTEIMFFFALVSAYMVIKATKVSWVPPNEIRLPVWATSINTAILFFSGISLFLAGRALSRDQSIARGHLFRALISAAFFVTLQGFEWVRLIKHGMTFFSGIYGATFYLLIGSHALHAVAGVIVLAWALRKLVAKELTRNTLTAVEIFWYFIVGIWPVLFGLVYFQ